MDRDRDRDRDGDRDRDRDRRRLPPRDLDFPPEDQYGTGRGQSYRPGGARERSPIPSAMRDREDRYRARSPPPRRDGYGDSYRARSRTPPRGGVAADYRRRSPTPPRYRERERVGDFRGGDTYRARPARSPLPPRRDDLLPRDDLFRRDAGRDYRDERDFGGRRDDRDRPLPPPGSMRSPLPRYRERSPLPLKRGREPSPMGSRGRRTPPPPKRERLASPPPRSRYDDYPPSSRGPTPPRYQQQAPRGRYSPEPPRDRRPSPPRGAPRDYRMRSRSPITRNDRVDPRDVDDWRARRSPSTVRGAYDRRDEGGRDSVATSRRSSPHVHPSRLAAVGADDRVTARDRERPARSPVDDTRRIASPRPVPVETNRDMEMTEDRLPPTRAPPSGPAGYRAPLTSMAPPTGPAAATSISAHARVPAAPPSGPRAASTVPVAPRGRGATGFAGDFRGGRGGFSGGMGFRGGRGGSGAAPGGGFGSGGDTFSRGVAPHQDHPAGPPSGPRGSFSSSSNVPAVPFRPSSNSTATTYPRSQRFAPNGQPIADTPSAPPTPRNNSDSMTTSANVAPTGPRAFRRPTEPAADRPIRTNSMTNATPAIHPALASLPQIIPGGQKAPPLVDTSRLARLQEEAEKLRKQIEEKEARKRKSLREWERMSREVEVAGLRSELASEAVRKLETDEDLGGLGLGLGGGGHREAAF